MCLFNLSAVLMYIHYHGVIIHCLVSRSMFINFFFLYLRTSTHQVIVYLNPSMCLYAFTHLRHCSSHTNLTIVIVNCLIIPHYLLIVSLSNVYHWMFSHSSCLGCSPSCVLHFTVINTHVVLVFLPLYIPDVFMSKSPDCLSFYLLSSVYSHSLTICHLCLDLS